MGKVHIVLYIISLVYLIKCGYPPTGDEVVPGSVLLPATRRGRYLANIVRRQAVDGTGIKFNKDADRMNAEAKKKVDVLSEELLPYIIAEQERRTTLHKRVMTAIQNGEKGVTIAEMRNKPPLIIRKGLMYRCPANRAPKEPDGSGALMCEDEITPTQIMYDACLSAEDKELYNAENKYFFCNRHKIEGPDLPRNGTTVYGCAPIERTSFNYTTSKCSLEDTEDVVVHYRYYPDRTYKYVTELDPDREVCDHWNPCQIGYIFSLPSPDMATPASELWPDAPDTFEDYEKDEIVPPIPEDSMTEFVHPSAQSYTSSPRTLSLPQLKGIKFTVDKVQLRNGKGKARTLSLEDYSVKISGSTITITPTFEEFSPKYFGNFYATVNANGKKTSIKFLTLEPSNIEVTSKTVEVLHGQKLNVSGITVTCDNCRIHGLMVRARDNNVYNTPSSHYKVHQLPNRMLAVEVSIKDPQPQDFGDYFALIENSRGQEERHKVLTVRAPENDVENLVQLNRFEVACDEQGNYNNITKYDCQDCQLTDILCNGQSVLAAGRVTIIPQSHQISYNFPSFADPFSCVYMGFFKIKDTVYKKVVAVIENNSKSVTIPEVPKVPAPKDDDSLDQEIVFNADSDSCEVREVIVNGINLEQSARRSNSGSQAMFVVQQNSINIHIGPFQEVYAGMYQAKFACGDETITKNLMEVTLDGGGETKPDDSEAGGDESDKSKGDPDKPHESGSNDDAAANKENKGGAQAEIPDIKVTPFAMSCETNADACAGDATYECDGCSLTVKCGANAADATKIKVDAAAKKISFDLKQFKDEDACVYMGEFDVKGTKVMKPVGVIENKAEGDKGVTITGYDAAAVNVKPDEPFEKVIEFATGAAKIKLKEILVNGQSAILKEKPASPAPVDSYYEVMDADKKVTIHIGKMTAALAGHYQVKFTLGEDAAAVTKNLMNLELDTPKAPSGDTHTDNNGNNEVLVSGLVPTKIACKIGEACTVSETDFTCAGCDVPTVQCNGNAATVAIPAADKITYKLDSFKDEDACVYMATFKKGGATQVLPVAIIENMADDNSPAGVKIPKVDLIPAEDGKELTKNIEIQGPPTATVTAVNVNGLKLEPKTTDDKPHFEATGTSLKIVIPKMSKEYVGHYQATFAIDPAATPVIQVTKNILEVKPK